MTDGWGEFFVAMAGAGAALAGLIVVAMSVTIKQILDYPSLPRRAAATIAALVTVVIASGVMLMPHQTSLWLGIELIVIALLASVFYANLTVAVLRDKPRQPFRYNIYKLGTAWLQWLPFIVGGILVVAGQSSGIAWVAVGVLLAIVYAMLNAWVLLIEILR